MCCMVLTFRDDTCTFVPQDERLLYAFISRLAMQEDMHI
jgi:hypothetical protein